MDLLGIGDIITRVGDVAAKITDDLITSEEERAAIDIQKRLLDIKIALQQHEINKIEAQHKSRFVAGWRPFIGWIGGLSLGYQFLVYPLLTWVLVFFNIDSQPPPVFNSDVLMTLVAGMLGVGGMRSFDKVKNTQTDKI